MKNPTFVERLVPIAMIHYIKPDAFELEAAMAELLCDSFGSSTAEDFTQSDPIVW